MPQPPAPATRGDEDPMSPTVMLQSYLRSRGLPLTSANIRAAIDAQARGQNIIPGLVSDEPSTDPGVGGKGNVAGKVEQAPSRGQSLPIPPVPPAKGAVPPDQGATDTSAQPDVGSVPPSLAGLASAILGGSAAGAGYWAGGKFGGSRGGDGGEFVGNVPPGPSGRTIDVPQPAVTGDRYDLLPSPSGIASAQPAVAGPPPSPMENAMQRAIAPPAGAQPIDMPPYVSDPYAVMRGASGLPPGISPTDAAIAGAPNMLTQPAQSRVGVPQMLPTNTGTLSDDALRAAGLVRLPNGSVTLMHPANVPMRLPPRPRLPLNLR